MQDFDTFLHMLEVKVNVKNTFLYWITKENEEPSRKPIEDTTTFLSAFILQNFQKNLICALPIENI